MRTEQEIQTAIDLLNKIADSRDDIHTEVNRDDLPLAIIDSLRDKLYMDVIRYAEALLWAAGDQDEENGLTIVLAKFNPYSK